VGFGCCVKGATKSGYDADLPQPLIPRVLGILRWRPSRAALAAPLRLEISTAWRPEISWPASSGICQKKYADTAEMNATTRKAGAKHVGGQFGGMVQRQVWFPPRTADRDAGGNRQLLVDADQRGGAAHLRRVDLAYATVLIAVIAASGRSRRPRG